MWVEHSFGGTPLWTSAPLKDLWSLWWCRWTLFQKRTGPTECQYPIRYCTPGMGAVPPPTQPSPSHWALIMTNKSLLWTCYLMDHCWYLQHVLADLWVSKVTENGLSDHQFFCRTHLGHLLSPGDTVYGCVRTVSLSYWVIDIIYTRITNIIKHGEAIQYFTFGFINFIVHLFYMYNFVTLYTFTDLILLMPTWTTLTWRRSRLKSCPMWWVSDLDVWSLACKTSI